MLDIRVDIKMKFTQIDIDALGNPFKELFKNLHAPPLCRNSGYAVIDGGKDIGQTQDTNNVTVPYHQK